MTIRRQIFTAPGTWTNPGTVTRVWVAVMGGGGGGAIGTTSPPTLGPGVPGGRGNGGAGGFRYGIQPVSGPQPVTIGAGATASSGPGTALGFNYTTPSDGGTTTFGPVPAGFSVGGGASVKGFSSPLLNAPPIGGGGAGAFPGSIFSAAIGGLGGSNGQPSTGQRGGGSVGQVAGSAVNYASVGVSYVTPGGYSIHGVGGGGGWGTNGGGVVAGDLQADPSQSHATYPTPNINGVSNTGGGGSGVLVSPTPSVIQAGNGGSGFVIVEWDE